MLRVHFDKAPFQDHDANEVEFTMAGGVVLRRVEFRVETDPNNLRNTVIRQSNPQLVIAYGPGSGWVALENLELDAPALNAREIQEALTP